MKLYLSIIIFAISLSVSAQQATNFGLFYLNNMQHNPAAVGTNNHDIKMFANFRYQYFTVTDKPYRTISASVEAKILKAKKSKHYFGVGGSFINDASGDGRYGVNLATIPIAYHIFFNDNNSLSLGVAPGLYQRTIQPGAFTWQHQWTGTEFNQGLPGEDVGNRVVDRFNLDAGLFFKHQTSITNKFYFGVSAGHILEQDLGFFAEDKLERRYVGQFGLSHRFELTRFGISPNVYAMVQGDHRNIIFGSNFDFYLIDPSLRTIFINPNVFSLGVYHRLMEGIILNFQFSFEGFTVAASYDSNINSMIPHSKSVGGFEVAVMYDLIINKKQKFLY